MIDFAKEWDIRPLFHVCIMLFIKKGRIAYVKDRTNCV